MDRWWWLTVALLATTAACGSSDDDGPATSTASGGAAGAHQGGAAGTGGSGGTGGIGGTGGEAGTGGSGSAVIDEVVALGEKLPMPLAGHCAATIGEDIYLFGGDTGSSLTPAIVKFSPATGKATKLASELPSGRIITGAASDGQRGYVFGGFDGTSLTDEIVAFNPGDGAVSVVGQLPSARGRAAVFFASGYFYVLGGNLGSLQPTGVLGDIVRFDPAATTVELLGEQLPAKVASRIGAVYDGTSAYLIGGLGMGSKTDAIVRYAPGGSATTMGAALPEPYDGGAYVEHAGHVFIFGGAPISAEPGSDQVLEYVPATDTVTDTGMHLPSARKGLAGAAAGGAIYLFGGKGPSGPLDEIVKVSFE